MPINQPLSESSKLVEELPRITDAPPSEAPSPSCTNCESSSHTLVNCLYAPNGTIFGCPFCKNGTHLMEDCSNFAAASTVDVVRVLIWDRSAMPAWQTRVPWHRYLAEFMSSADFLPIVDHLHRRTVLQKPFPWGENFARQFSQGDTFSRLQSQLDDGISCNLPRDPITAGIVAACETYHIPFVVSWRGRDPVAREFSGPASTSTSSQASSPISSGASSPAVVPSEFYLEDLESDPEELDVGMGVLQWWDFDEWYDFDERPSEPGRSITAEELRQYGIHLYPGEGYSNFWGELDGA